VVVALGVVVALAGLTVLAGWVLAVPQLKSVLPGAVSMKPNTALAFVLAGMALALLANPSASLRRKRAGQLLALLVTLIAGLTWCQYLFGWHLGIDELLFKDDPGAAATLIPGRMAPSTAACFLLLGPALVGIGWEPRRGGRPAEWLSLLVGCVSSSSVVEYVIGQPILYGFSEYTRMALHTAIVIFGLSAGVLLARPAQGIVGALRSGRISHLEQRLLGAVALALLGVLGGGGWFYNHQEKYERRRVEADLATIAQFKADQIVQWRDERLGDAAVLMSSRAFVESVARWLADPLSGNSESVLARFQAMRRHNHYHDVLLVDGRGQVRLSLSGRKPTFHAETVEAVAAALRTRRPVLTDLHRPPGNPTPQLEVIAPLLAGNETTSEPIGAVVLVFEAQRFLYPLTQSWPTASRSAEISVVRREGDSACFLNDSRFRPDTALELRIPLSRLEAPAARAALGQEGVFRGTDYRGVKVLSVLKQIPGASWGMVAKMDEAEALADWRLQSYFIRALMLLLVVVVLAAAGVVHQTTSKTRVQAQAAEVLRQREAELRDAQRVAHLGNWWWEPATDAVVWSEEIYRVFGLDPQRSAPSVEEQQRLYTPESWARLSNALQTALKTGTPYALDLEFLHPDGTTRWINARGEAVREADGRVERLRGTAHDITARKRAEETVARSMVELKRSNTELQDFAYVASHDLQEPLRKIQAFGERLHSKCAAELGPQGQDYLRRMEDAARRMALLIEDLLSYSRVTTQARRFEPVDLDEVAREVIKDLETRLQQTQGRVEVHGLPVLDADPTQMRQLLQNLLGNALKFHRPDAPPVVKVYRVEAVETPGLDGQVCQIAVEDNGIGFDEKYLDRIFTIFQRLHERGAYEGSGIGLAICRKIALRHDGSLTARSSPGAGATFIVTLPLHQSPGDDLT
jgi:PAS domain S-box-containing protein